MSTPTIPEQIIDAAIDLHNATEALALPGLSVDTRKVLGGMATDAERELRRLRREFASNQRALDAARA